MPNNLRTVSRACVILVLLCGLVAAEQPTPNAPTVREGWDWSLPEGIRPVPYSGFCTRWGRRFDESVTVNGDQIGWKDLNPAPGRYDWDLLRAAIDRNRRAGMRTGIHLMGVERTSVPDWVVERFHPPVIDVPPLKPNQPWRIQVVPPWHPEVNRAFLELLAAFAATGIARREEVVYGYIHGISSSRGEELQLRRDAAEIYERETGLTPQVFARWLRGRLEAMLVAFQGVEHKLAWMSDGPVGQDEKYQEVTKDIWKEAIQRGTGIRGGGIDFMHVLFQSPAWSSTLTEDGYCVVDDADPTIVGDRFRGDENEEYGPSWEWRFGPHQQHDYRHRISSLRGLQLRQNFQLVSPQTLALNPALNRYVVLAQGRTRESSPDAMAYLREAYTSSAKGPKPLRNIERWLIQREVPGSRSVPAEKVERFALGWDARDRHYDFDARRTDRAAGEDGLAFQLDPQWWKKPAPACVKVTFTDRQAARWRLTTTGSSGRTIASPPIRNVGDGKRKTATFPIADLAARRGFPGGMDFRLVTEGPGDLTVTVVRVIRTDFRE